MNRRTPQDDDEVLALAVLCFVFASAGFVCGVLASFPFGIIPVTVCGWIMGRCTRIVVRGR